MEQGVRGVRKEDMVTETEVRMMGLLALRMEDGRRSHEPRSGERLLEAGKGKEVDSPPESREQCSPPDFLNSVQGDSFGISGVVKQ